MSESRRFYTAAYLDPNVIAGNKLYIGEDQQGLLFSLISSSMFITWQRAVGERLKSDLNFANTLTWNTFPVPKLEEKPRERIIKTGKGVLAACELHPFFFNDTATTEIYTTRDTLSLHDALDREVDKAMGAPRKLTTERQRQEILFANYVSMTSTT